MKHTRKSDIFVIGFALFSMFFGAGNVIFPPISVWSPVPNGCWVLSATISLISALRWRPCLPFSTAAALRALHAGSGGFPTLLMCAMPSCFYRPHAGHPANRSQHL